MQLDQSAATFVEKDSQGDAKVKGILVPQLRTSPHLMSVPEGKYVHCGVVNPPQHQGESQTKHRTVLTAIEENDTIKIVDMRSMPD